MPTRVEDHKFWGWGVLGFSSCLMIVWTLALFAFTEMGHPGRVVVLSAAMSIWPGYAINMGVFLYSRKMRPSVPFVLGMLTILIGMMIYSFPLSMGDAPSDRISVLVSLGGFASIAPFVKRRVYDLDLQERREEAQD